MASNRETTTFHQIVVKIRKNRFLFFLAAISLLRVKETTESSL